MPAVHPARDRFAPRLDWLVSHHSFNFDRHDDPARTGYRSLRVINDDVIAPGHGVGMHPHRDMEIVTWVLSGAIRHRDSTGGEGHVRAGEVQVMHAGTGIRHSEENDDPAEPMHLLQIWLEPVRSGLAPGYAQRACDLPARPGSWVAIAGALGAAIQPTAGTRWGTFLRLPVPRPG